MLKVDTLQTQQKLDYLKRDAMKSVSKNTDQECPREYAPMCPLYLPDAHHSGYDLAKVDRAAAPPARLPAASTSHAYNINR